MFTGFFIIIRNFPFLHTVLSDLTFTIKVYFYQEEEKMNCPKCGKEIPDNTMFCTSCGANIDSKPTESRSEDTKFSWERDRENEESSVSRNNNASERAATTFKTAQTKKGMSAGGIILIIVLVIIAIAFFSNYKPSDITDQIANVVQMEDSHVTSVKNGTPYSYPDITYDQAFSSFFSKPTWKYFVGTSEGPDEDNDGKPDYTESNVDIVEFTGYCLYQGSEVKALIQFRINDDGETFTASYLSFNDVPQNYLMLSAIITKAFGDYENSH